jgi:hypothetical protein
MYDETKRMLAFILDPSLLNQVLIKNRSLLHHDSTNLLALDFVSNSEYFCSIDDDDQRNILAKLTARPWTDRDLDDAMTVPPRQNLRII